MIKGLIKKAVVFVLLFSSLSCFAGEEKGSLLSVGYIPWALGRFDALGEYNSYPDYGFVLAQGVEVKYDYMRKAHLAMGIQTSFLGMFASDIIARTVVENFEFIWKTENHLSLIFSAMEGKLEFEPYLSMGISLVSNNSGYRDELDDEAVFGGAYFFKTSFGGGLKFFHWLSKDSAWYIKISGAVYPIRLFSGGFGITGDLSGGYVWRF